jgi:hypothetical protein
MRDQELLEAEANLQFTNFLSIVAITKNEGHNMREWIEYHILVGVEKFYIYDNESTDGTLDILRPYIESGIVDYTYFPGHKQQRPAYLDAFQKHGHDTNWIAPIDMDEFIVPLEYETIPQFLKNLPATATQLCVGWMVYGNSGHENKHEGLVIEAFKYNSGKASNVGKFIAKPRYITDVLGHKGVMTAGNTVDENGEIIKHTAWYKDRRLKGGFKINKMRISHYQIKSWEEYSLKYERGAAGSGNYKKYTRKTYDKLNDNSVLDTTMDKYIQPLKNILNIK